MVVIVAIASASLAAVLVTVRRSRSESGAILDHQRAIAALREAERLRPPEPTETRPGLVSTDHVHILDQPPPVRSGARRPSRPPVRRPPARRPAKGRRRNAAEIAERPTIASLPARAYAPIEWLAPPVEPPDVPDVDAATPAPQPSGVECAPMTIGPRGHRPRRAATRVGAVAAGVLVLALGTAVVVGAEYGGSPRATAQRPPSRPATTRPRVSTTQPPSTTTPATSPVVPVVATASGDGTVTVAVPFSLTLAPTGSCWVSVRAANGQSLFEGTLQAGERRQVVGSGPLVIRLGNTSAMSIVLNGAPLDLSRVARTANVSFVST